MSFWQSKAKLRPADILFSKYIRERDDWHCVYKFKCSGLEDFRNNKGALTTSHFYKRANETIRFDPRNADSGCRPCHRWIEDTAEGKKALEEWKKKQLGEEEYKKLMVLANTTGHRDDKLITLYLKQLMKEYAETI